MSNLIGLKGSKIQNQLSRHSLFASASLLHSHASLLTVPCRTYNSGRNDGFYKEGRDTPRREFDGERRGGPRREGFDRSRGRDSDRPPRRDGFDRPRSNNNNFERGNNNDHFDRSRSTNNFERSNDYNDRPPRRDNFRNNFANNHGDGAKERSLYDPEMAFSKPIGRKVKKPVDDSLSGRIESYDLSSLNDEWEEFARHGSSQRRQDIVDEKNKVREKQEKKRQKHDKVMDHMRSEYSDNLEAFGFSNEYKNIKKHHQHSKNLHNEMKLMNQSVFKTLRAMDNSRYQAEDNTDIPSAAMDSIDDLLYTNNNPNTSKAEESVRDDKPQNSLVELSKTLRKIVSKKEVHHTIGCFLGSFDVLPAFSQDLQRASKGIVRIRDKVQHRQQLELTGLIVDKLDPYNYTSDLLRVNNAKGTYRNIMKRAKDMKGAYGTSFDMDDITLGLHRNKEAPMVPDTVVFNLLIKALAAEAAFAFPRNYHTVPELPCPAQAVPLQEHATVGSAKQDNLLQSLDKLEDKLVKKSKYMTGLKDYLRLLPHAKPALEINFEPHSHPAVVAALRALDYMHFVGEHPDELISFLHEKEHNRRQALVIQHQSDDSLLKNYIAEKTRKLEHQMEKQGTDSGKKHRLKQEIESLKQIKAANYETLAALEGSEQDLERSKQLVVARTKQELKQRFPGMFVDPEADKLTKEDYVRSDLLEKYGFKKEDEEHNSHVFDRQDEAIKDMYIGLMEQIQLRPTLVSFLPLLELAGTSGDMLLTQALLVRMFHWNVLQDAASTAEVSKRELDLLRQEQDFSTREAELEDLVTKNTKWLNEAKTKVLLGLTSKKPLSFAQVCMFESFWRNLTVVPAEQCSLVQAERLRVREEHLAKHGGDAEALHGLDSAQDWPSWLWPAERDAAELGQLAIFENVDFSHSKPPVPVVLPQRLPWIVIPHDQMPIDMLLLGLKSCTFAQSFENSFITESALQQNKKLLQRSRQAMWIQEEEARQELEMLKEQEAGEVLVPDTGKVTKHTQLVQELADKRLQAIDRLLQCVEGWLQYLEARVRVASIQSKQHFTHQALSKLQQELLGVSAEQSITPPPALDNVMHPEIMQELFTLSRALTYHAQGVALAHLDTTSVPYKDLSNKVLPRIDRILLTLARWGIVVARPFLLSNESQTSPLAMPLTVFPELDDMLSSVPRNRLLAPLGVGQRVHLDLGSGDGEHAVEFALNHQNTLVLTNDILSHRLADVLLYTRITSIPAFDALQKNIDVDQYVDVEHCQQVLATRSAEINSTTDNILDQLLKFTSDGGQHKQNVLQQVTSNSVTNIINTDIEPPKILQEIMPKSLCLDSADSNIDNLFAYCGGALELLGSLPKSSVDSIHIMHPPPPTIDSYGRVPIALPTERLRVEDLEITLNSRNTLLTEQMMYLLARCMRADSNILIVSDDERVGAWLNKICPFDDYAHSSINKKGNRKKVKDGQEQDVYVPSSSQLPGYVPLLSEYFDVHELDTAQLKREGLLNVKSRYQRLAEEGKLQSKHTAPHAQLAYRLVRSKKEWQ